MNALQRVREHQRWFFVSCVVVGAAVSRLPFLSEPNGNMAVVPYLATWFGCGVIAGFLMPDRPWRWAAALALGPPIIGIALNPQMAAFMLVTIPLLPIVATPILAGAYLGRALVLPGGAVSPVAAVVPTSAPIRSRLLIVFVVGLLASAIPAFFVSNGSATLLHVWMAVAPVVAAVSVTWGRSGISKGTGVAVGVGLAALAAKMIYDSITSGPDHNLFPFEVIIVIVSTGGPAVLAALLTQWIVSRTRTA